MANVKIGKMNNNDNIAIGEGVKDSLVKIGKIGSVGGLARSWYFSCKFLNSKTLQKMSDFGAR